MYLRCLVFLLLLLPAACTPPAGPSASDPVRLRSTFAELPGASLLSGPGLGVSYPREVLYREGAVLPLAGGTAMLDPLARLLAAYPELVWEGTVRARTGRTAAADLGLATKRAELLERYFRNRGVGRDRLRLEAVAGEGPPLALKARQSEPRAARASSSSGEKR